MPAQRVVVATLAGYFAILILLGVACRGRTRDGVDFFLGGRALGPVVASLSASASSSSAWTLLGVSGFAFARGLSAIWLFPACVGGFVLNWYVLAPGLRRLSHETDALTATEVLAGPPGSRLRRAVAALASAIILASLATYVAAQFQGAGKAFAETLGLSATAAILLGSAIVVFYTLLGGFWAVSLTDTLQGLLMAAAAVILPVAALLAVGPAELGPKLRAVPVDGFASPFGAMKPAAATGLVVGLLGIGLGYPGQPHVVNRFMSLRQGARELRTARRVAIAWAAVIYAGMILLGLCARVLLPGSGDPEGAYMRAAGELLPPLLAGVMIAAVLSAVMSTADSQLLVAASSVTHDLGLGGATRASLLVRSRIVVLLLSGGAVAAALLVQERIFSRVLFAWSSMGCAFGPLLLVRALRGPVAPGWAIASMSVGFTLSVGAYAARQLGHLGEWAGVWERVVPFAAALLLAIAGGAAVRRAPRRADAGGPPLSGSTP
jgi:sodium/proline symporter